MTKRSIRITVRRTSLEREYAVFLDEVKGKIRQARSEGFRSVNRTMMQVFWEIGHGIVECQSAVGSFGCDSKVWKFILY